MFESVANKVGFMSIISFAVERPLAGQELLEGAVCEMSGTIRTPFWASSRRAKYLHTSICRQTVLKCLRNERRVTIYA